MPRLSGQLISNVAVLGRALGFLTGSSDTRRILNDVALELRLWAPRFKATVKFEGFSMHILMCGGRTRRSAPLINQKIASHRGEPVDYETHLAGMVAS